jgi:serralysin
LGDAPSTDSFERVVIGAQGFVTGFNIGLSLFAVNSLITNLGMISGGTGVGLYGVGTGTSKIVNLGTISGDYAVNSQRTEAISVVNRGDILGQTYGVNGSDLADYLRNSGHIQGQINLNGGADLYDGRGGTVEGTVNGGSDDDTFRLGAGPETVDGGSGLDTLDFSFGGGIRVCLDDSGENTRTAFDDTYSNIETIIGSRHGSDCLQGDAAGNSLQGKGGNDTLSGGDGADSLAGGAKVDTLTGGLGNDHFLFFGSIQAGDTITDFRNVTGDIEQIDLFALGFGGGLAPGFLAALRFVTGTTAQAGDVDDRVIFKTTDHTLWFDTNGNATGGLSLIARLDASGVVTAADIFVF